MKASETSVLKFVGGLDKVFIIPPFQRKSSAWRQFKIAKMMLKDMKENPYKFPEA